MKDDAKKVDLDDITVPLLLGLFVVCVAGVLGGWVYESHRSDRYQADKRAEVMMMYADKPAAELQAAVRAYDNVGLKTTADKKVELTKWLCHNTYKSGQEIEALVAVCYKDEDFVTAKKDAK